MKLQIGSYNIMHAQVHEAHLRGVKVINPEGVADVIAANGAVICGLNEVDVNAKRSFWTHAPYQIAERLRAITVSFGLGETLGIMPAATTMGDEPPQVVG